MQSKFAVRILGGLLNQMGNSQFLKQPFASKNHRDSYQGALSAGLELTPREVLESHTERKKLELKTFPCQGSFIGGESLVCNANKEKDASEAPQRVKREGTQEEEIKY